MVVVGEVMAVWTTSVVRVVPDAIARVVVQEDLDINQPRQELSETYLWMAELLFLVVLKRQQCSTMKSQQDQC
jgi:hypothetical protein